MLTLLLIAGNETTSNLIGNGTLALLRHPGQLEWLRAHPEGVDDAVEELVRFDSPVQADRRVAREDVEIGGRRVRRGEQVVLLLGAANRDPAQFADAERLDLSRGDKSHVGFGRGIHFCLGAPLARLEAQLAFPRLFERFPDLRLAGGEPRFKDHIVLRGLERLPVTT
jgi:cytochrome P450